MQEVACRCKDRVDLGAGCTFVAKHLLGVAHQILKPDAVAVALWPAAMGRQEHRDPYATAVVRQPQQIRPLEKIHPSLSSGRAPVRRESGTCPGGGRLPDSVRSPIVTGGPDGKQACDGQIKQTYTADPRKSLIDTDAATSI